jgi:hypothetical protein
MFLKNILKNCSLPFYAVISFTIKSCSKDDDPLSPAEPILNNRNGYLRSKRKNDCKNFTAVKQQYLES